MPIFQYQARPSVPFLPETVPPQVSGMAWFVPFDQPFFSTAMKPWLYKMGQRSNALPPPPAAPSGIPWMLPWEPPRFRGYPAEHQQTGFWFQSPTTLPTIISGQAWYRAWEPPFFPTTVKVWLQETEIYGENFGSFAPAVSGISWMIGWEPPYFKGYPSVLQQSEMFVKTREVFPPITAVMWWKPFEQPFFPTRVKVWLQPTESFKALTPTTLPPQIAGMAWYKQFDQPKQVKIPVEQQKYSIQGSTFVQVQTASYSVYIIF